MVNVEYRREAPKITSYFDIRHSIFDIRYFFLFFVLLLPCKAHTQSNPDSSTVNKARLRLIGFGGAALYAGSMAGLYTVWYSDYPMTRFHFFNDNDEWMQMDKVGHAFTSYYEGVYGIRMLKWAGLDNRKAAWYGGTWGFLLQTPIEILDGFSENWGASWGDIAANTAGTALVVSQQLAWEEQRVLLKFSFSPSSYAALKPNLLGQSLPHQIIKDYNGQTYWLSGNLAMLSQSEKLPRWLNLAIGYGADGMLRGTPEDQRHDPIGQQYARARQFYLSPDIDLAQIKTRSKFLKLVLNGASYIKIPAPTVEFHSRNGFRLHLLYF